MKIRVGNEMKDGDVVPFTPFNEPWAEYHLEDGSVVRFRSTITQVIKLWDKGEGGDPVYVCQSTNQMSVEEKK